MDDHVIDCCSLLNLYTGWGGLTELRALRRTWYVCDAVLSETEYTREYAPDGTQVSVPLDAKALVNAGLLLAARPETERELEDFIGFATEVDDGEAQALAIARNRGYVLLTDDRKAVAVARRPEVGVRLVSTARVLQAWAQLDPANEARLREVLTRISTLARFTPRPGDADYAWWRSYFSG
jgi:hypothetical protein